MFNLITVAFALVLVAALAITSLSFVGPTFGEGSDRAKANQIINEATQINSAVTIAKGRGAPVGELEDLTDEDAQFLREIPSGAGTWEMDGDNLTVVAETESVCRALNVEAGIPNAETDPIPSCSESFDTDYFCCEDDE